MVLALGALRRHAGDILRREVARAEFGERLGEQNRRCRARWLRKVPVVQRLLCRRALGRVEAQQLPAQVLSVLA